MFVQTGQTRAASNPAGDGRDGEADRGGDERAGWLVATEGCLPSAAGARVRLSAGKFTVTDGPFAETKELIGGFAIIKANSKQEAIEHTKYFLQVVGGGETEIRQLHEAPAAAPANA